MSQGPNYLRANFREIPKKNSETCSNIPVYMIQIFGFVVFQLEICSVVLLLIRISLQIRYGLQIMYILPQPKNVVK
jgi:hypothetical protein